MSQNFCSYYVRSNITKVINHLSRLRLKLLKEYQGNGAKDYARLNGFRAPANSLLAC